MERLTRQTIKPCPPVSRLPVWSVLAFGGGGAARVPLGAKVSDVAPDVGFKGEYILLAENVRDEFAFAYGRVFANSKGRTMTFESEVRVGKYEQDDWRN